MCLSVFAMEAVLDNEHDPTDQDSRTSFSDRPVRALGPADNSAAVDAPTDHHLSCRLGILST